MTSSKSSSSMLATISRSSGSGGSLTNRVRDLPTEQFIILLDQITSEFEHFLRAIDMINNQSLETLLEQILEAFTYKIGQILEAERVSIFMLDKDKNELWAKVAVDAAEIRFPADKGIAGFVATHKESLNIPDAYSHPMFNQEVDKQTGFRTRNILCLPILDPEGEVVAVVQLLNKSGDRTFDDQDERSFKEFASSIGVILQSCNKFYIAARNQKGVEALLKATSSLGQSLDLEKTIEMVLNEARDLMNADRGTLFMLDHDTQELWFKVPKANSDEKMEIRIPVGKGIAGYVAQREKTLNIPNAYEDPRFDSSTDQRTGYTTRNILCMPVFNSSGTLIGVTQLINKHHGTFTHSDEEFMRAFNIQAGIAIENAKLFESVLVERQYQKDMLQSLSDAVISTDMAGRIVTINDAALELLGCPIKGNPLGRVLRDVWEQRLLCRPVWDIIAIDNLDTLLQASLSNGTKQYIPEQSLRVATYSLKKPGQAGADAHPDDSAHPPSNPPEAVEKAALQILAIPDPSDRKRYIPWNDQTFGTELPAEAHPAVEQTLTIADQTFQVPMRLDKAQVRQVERSINLTVNPLTNPEGGVRGGLVVLEDISQEKRMKTTLYRYMTPGVAERVMALGEDALMEGERKEVTILFSDIRGYTTLTENLQAVEVVQLLNDYFETMVEAVFNFEGTLDKFIGDALMAVFGAPLPLNNHAMSAVSSALDMRRRLKEFNTELGEAGRPAIRIGIGISSGEVVSGNIGSQRKMEYTVIGDGVNISSRLEGITKQYGCDIVISEHTYELCESELHVRELDRIRVKGKNEPVSIYDVIGLKTDPIAAQVEDFIATFEAGRVAYTTGNFDQAIAYFEQALALAPAGRDDACSLFIGRSQEYKLTPPPDNWDGVFTMKTK